MQAVQGGSPGARAGSGAAADEAAARNWRRNREALQPSGAARECGSPGGIAGVEWLFGRDGALTALLPGERWWAGCSVPRAAARFMLKTMEAGGNVACFLSPMHAAQLREALDRLEKRQAIVAIVPDAATLWVILHCEDFSADIADHRLWFACGNDWEGELAKLFAENPGLPTPAQFIRPILADAAPADRLISPAQRAFAAETSRRAERIGELLATARPRAEVRRLCLIAPTHFRLWDLAPDVLAEVLHGAAGSGVEVRRFDADDPASASPLALAAAVAECNAVVAANLSRADAPGLAPHDLPWITWITSSRMPAASSAGPRDQLLLADADWRSAVREAGWDASRVRVASWPARAVCDPPATARLVLLADTETLEPPKKVEDFSSHKLLWEMIEQELTRDPFSLGGDVDGFLRSRMDRLRIPETGFDRGLFIDCLIVPAYQQGLAALLVREGIPLRIHGKGWDGMDCVADAAAGPVSSAGEFEAAIANSSALVHACPSRQAHPIDAIGRPVVRAFGLRRENFIREARRPSSPADAPVATPPLSWDVIAPLLGIHPAPASGRQGS